MSKMAVVVGLGFAGSVIARSLAEAGFEVTALEKRPHVAGNMYEHTRLNGVRVHNYGPHIFHTNNQQVYDYLKRFSDFYPYSHRVVGWIDGKLVPIPFNYTSIDSLFAPAKAAMLKDKLTKAFPGKEKCFISELVEHTDPDIKSLGNYIMDRVFVHYTAKQWGVPVEEVDKSVIDRVPVVLGTDDRYFRDTIQMMPIHGFTELFENMLSHPKINVQTNSDAMLRLALHESSGNILLDGAPFNGPVCYTGAIDELFNNEFGVLPYRSTNLVFEDIEKESYQSNSVINYPNSEEFTRITEFKLLTLQNVPDATTILKEYPTAYKPGSAISPFYPIANKSSLLTYEKYKDAASCYKDLYLCGRLAEYKYYNMDAVVERALQISRSIIESKRYK